MFQYESLLWEDGVISNYFISLKLVMEFPHNVVKTHLIKVTIHIISLSILND